MKNKKTLILAIGSGAQNIVNYLYRENNNIDIICLGYKKEELEKSNTKTIYFNDVTKEYITEKICDPFLEYNQRIGEDNKKILESELNKFNQVIIVNTLGGAQSAYILPAIVEMTQKFKEIDYKIVTTIPFIFEGQKRRIRALAALGELCILGCTVGKNLFIYDDNEIMDLLSKKDDVHDAFLAVDKKVSDIIKTILELK